MKKFILIGLIVIIPLTLGILGFFYIVPNYDFEYSTDLRHISVLEYPNQPTDGEWGLIQPGLIPISNPLKGFMPYTGEYSTFEYTMEYTYIPINAIVDEDPKSFDFSTIEAFLQDCSERGNHGVFRLFLDYPDEESALPTYIQNSEVNIVEYTQFGGGLSPDYNHPIMIELYYNLISQVAENFDGDSRIGFIQIGILGHWGEWHTYPREELFANSTTQNTILQLFDIWFNETKILARYPSDLTKNYDVGFHDDSFAYETLGSNEWFFFNQLQTNNLLERWKFHPIGGEVRPEIQTSVFRKLNLKGENISECIEKVHASWMLITSLFDLEGYEYGKLNQEQIKKATQISQEFGYIFTVCYSKIESFKLDKNQLNVSIVINNFGVAPFYYKWPIEIGILSNTEQILWSEITDSNISSILPKEPKEFKFRFESSEFSNPQASKIAIRIPNLLENGPPINFANENLIDGWVIISEL